MSAAMGCGEPDQTRAPAVGRSTQWTMAQSDVGRPPARARVWTAVGGGKLLQRIEADDGRGFERPPSGAATGRGRLPGVGLRPSPLGPDLCC